MSNITSSAQATTSAQTTNELWHCADRSCNTGQTYLPRNEYGRKVVSDFFGRNKRETKEIHADVWHMMCRKSYQRSKYAAEKAGPKALCDFYLAHIKAQLDRIRLWRPDAKFTIQLERPAKQRLTLYHDALRRNGGNVGEAKAAVAVQPAVNGKGKLIPLSLVQAVKVEHAEHIDAHFSGNNKTLDFLATTVVPWIEGEVARNSMVQMPPIEFLLNQTAAGENVVDPSTNYERWVAHVDSGASFPAAASPKKQNPIHLVHTRPRPERTPTPPPPPSPPKRPSPRLHLFPKSALAAIRAREGAASPAGGRTPGAASGLPLYVPPAPVGDSSGKKRKRPSPVDTAAANAATTPSAPNSAYTLVAVSPIMVRGMAYAGGSKVWVKRDEQDESEHECESPLAKKSKHDA
ncbi:hypothetical protein PRZ48_005077 [Zasmidium cellare]|uniref:Uncharacterized protein n=1 Tax=Zasmidium cellare TaxID=395010 RepID=A0ABR0ESH1_ZASCE|nr:hypothetical protein PRZ48_005077 [Zasmidium cellare]